MRSCPGPPLRRDLLRRADIPAHGQGGRDAVRGDGEPARRRLHAGLHQPPAGRGARHQRPGHGPAGRRQGAERASLADRQGRARNGDGRARADHEGAGAPSCRRRGPQGDVGGRGPHLLAPFRRRELQCAGGGDRRPGRSGGQRAHGGRRDDLRPPADRPGIGAIGGQAPGAPHSQGLHRRRLGVSP